MQPWWRKEPSPSSKPNRYHCEMNLPHKPCTHSKLHNLSLPIAYSTQETHKWGFLTIALRDNPVKNRSNSGILLTVARARKIEHVDFLFLNQEAYRPKFNYALLLTMVWTQCAKGTGDKAWNHSISSSQCTIVSRYLGTKNRAFSSNSKISTLQTGSASYPP